jgi:hypothetical protein
MNIISEYKKKLINDKIPIQNTNKIIIIPFKIEKYNNDYKLFIMVEDKLDSLLGRPVMVVINSIDKNKNEIILDELCIRISLIESNKFIYKDPRNDIHDIFIFYGEYLNIEMINECRKLNGKSNGLMWVSTDKFNLRNSSRCLPKVIENINKMILEDKFKV